MAKGGGTTRNSSSNNPRGVGNAPRPVRERIMEARDRLIAMEAERDRLRASNKRADQTEADVLTAEINNLRQSIQVAERETSNYEQSKARSEQQLTRRINQSWNRWSVDELGDAVQGLRLNQNFRLEQAEDVDDSVSFTLTYSSYRGEYMIRQRLGGSTITVASAPTLTALIPEAKKRKLIPIGIVNKNDRGLV